MLHIPGEPYLDSWAHSDHAFTVTFPSMYSISIGLVLFCFFGHFQVHVEFLDQGSDPSHSSAYSIPVAMRDPLTHCSRPGNEPASMVLQKCHPSHCATMGTTIFLFFLFLTSVCSNKSIQDADFVFWTFIIEVALLLEKMYLNSCFLCICYLKLKESK